MYVLFLFEIQSPKGNLNIFTTFVKARSLVEFAELLEIIKLEV